MSVHIHIHRLVVDRAALADSTRGLHDEVVDRITHRLNGDAADAESAAERPAVSEAIAMAVAEHVSPRLKVARRG